MKQTVMKTCTLTIIIILLTMPGFSKEPDNNSADREIEVNKGNETEEKFSLPIFLYKPTYFMPVYYTNNPYKKMYRGRTPQNPNSKKREELDVIDFKFQLSFYVPIVKNSFGTHTDIDFAYSQVSYWQLYVTYSYFRETNYEPELFVKHAFSNSFSVTTGLVHQSNGVGDIYERAWNRVYLAGTYNSSNWFVNLKVWEHIYRSDEEFNRDIMRFMGYGQLLASFRFMGNTLSMFGYNHIESRFKRGSTGLTFSRILTDNTRIYGTVFHGFGQSLIEYNHRATSAGIGISLNDW